MRKAFRVLGAGLRGVVFAALLAVPLLEAYALAHGWALRRIALPPNVGNFERVRAPLEQDTRREEFSFAVVGDPGLSATFDGIMQQLGREPLSFAVVLGDFVRRATPEYHRCFVSNWVADISVPFPVFLVMGNHDVDPVRFPVSQFEELYGPTNFWFAHRGCLFIVLRIVGEPVGPRTTEESLQFLESVLSTRRQEYGRVVVFQHYPPPVSRDFRAREFEGADRLMQLCDRYRVDYVITGDFHGYARVQRGHTAYLITGGGGSPLTTRTFGRFHHAVVLKVGREGVSERILAVDAAGHEWGDVMERLAVGQVQVWLREHRLLAVVGNAAVVAIAAWQIRAFVRSRRRGRAAGEDCDA